MDVLRRETTTPEQCHFCVWDGTGASDYSGASERVRLPGRDYALYGGPMELALDPLDDFFDHISANLWWPEDHAWIVATEIDLCWTYAGGNAALIEKLLRNDHLEALRARLGDKHFYGSDTLNEALDAR